MAEELNPTLLQLLLQRAASGVSDFGSAVKESTAGIGNGLVDMLKAGTGDLPTIAKGGAGMVQTGSDFANAGPAGRLGIVGELTTGLPLRQIAGDVKSGNFAKAAGHATPGVAAAIAGIKGAKLAAPRKFPGIPSGPASGIAAEALDSRISGLPPAEGSGRPVFKAPTSAYEAVMQSQVDKAPPHYPIYPKQPPVYPKNALADGTLPKHRELVPEYRSKSGTALDVLDEMKSTKVYPDEPTSMNHLQKFGDDQSIRTPDHWLDSLGYEGPSGAGNSAASAAVLNKQRFDPAGDLFLDTDPEKLVARFKGIDDTMGFRSPADKALDTELFGREVKHPGMIDNLIQDLSNYFTGPRFDPYPDNQYPMFQKELQHELLKSKIDDLKNRSGNGR